MAQAWLVYRLTDSSFMLGLVTFCNLAPVLFLSLVTGVVADRANRRKILILVHGLSMLQALVLGILTLTGVIEPWHIIALATALGVLRAFEIPARNAFIAQIIPRAQLSNAIGLSSSTFNIARFVGPSIAGALVALWNEGPVFLINALSFSAILLALLGIKSEPRERTKLARFSTSMREGLRFTACDGRIRSGLLMLGAASLMSSIITVLMPVFARQVHQGGPSTMGVLMSAMGVGALLGALRLAARSSGEGLERVIGWAAFSLAASGMVFAMVQTLWAALLLLAIAGFAHTSAASSANAMIQLHTEDALRGRVMSIFSMTFVGMMPVGSLLGGIVAEYLGAPATVLSFGLGFSLVSVLYLRLEFRTRALGFTKGAVAEGDLSVNYKPAFNKLEQAPRGD